MQSRRDLLIGSLALLAPRVAWAEAGSPHYLAAAAMPSGEFALVGLDAGGGAIFRIPLPGRGHAAARHPARPEAVAFARRPGSFALILDCAEGRETRRLHAPGGRHFYGHGAFSADGALLFTTENAFDTGDGRLGIWDAADGYRRIGEIASGGIGPHEVLLMPDGRTLAAANGGIRTHPDSDRAKLNLPTMDPNITHIDTASGEIRAQLRPPADLRMNSTRHIAARADGTLAIALQWEGSEIEAPPLLALHRPGTDRLEMLGAGDRLQRRTRNYGGSVAFSGDGRRAAVTAPRGNLMLVFDADTGAFAGPVEAEDLCGVAPRADGFTCSTGAGRVIATDGHLARELAAMPLAFDNHLVRI